jgi:glycosyltransferase involved in cell wall biosynthesis
VTPIPGPSDGETIVRVLREGPAPLAHTAPGAAERALHVAVAIPAFTRGSGGHGTIFQLVSQLESFGHTCSIWLHDPSGDARPGAVVRRQILEQFTPVRAPVFTGFDEWYGADVAVATGWQTVYPVLTLPACRARAYLVQDHEPEFYATSAESYWAARTYDLDLYCIAASPWLLERVAARRSRPGSVFPLGIDHDTYHPRPVPRRRDTVVFYARSVTPRRAVPLGLLALEELYRRRPRTRIVMFGDYVRHPTSFPYERIEVASPEQLAWLYSQATVGLSLSLTNYSLVGLEMLGCGLPCVDLAGFSSETVYGENGPVELVDVDPIAIADAAERLMNEPDLWGRRSREGLEFVRGRTWERAAREVEAGLREALRQREALALA